MSSDEVLNASATNKGSLAMRFQTGGHAAGYTLDRIWVRSRNIANPGANPGAVPEIAMHQDSSSPGTKLCDIAVPNRIMEEPIMWISSLIHTYPGAGLRRRCPSQQQKVGGKPQMGTPQDTANTTGTRAKRRKAR